VPTVCSGRNSLAALAALLLLGGCAFGITITNAPTIPDCIQGSATKPCP
jgi:hypothetical protein